MNMDMMDMNTTSGMDMDMDMDMDGDMDMDHSSSDDHSTMDHSCPMTMYFHFDTEVCILFKIWHVYFAFGFTVSCFCVMLFGIVRELILYYGKYYLISRKYKECVPFWDHKPRLARSPNLIRNVSDPEKDGDVESGATAAKADNNNKDDCGCIGDEDNGPQFARYLTEKEANKINEFGEEDDDWDWKQYTVDSLIFVTSVSVGYCIMLIFMTYNIVLCICAVLGFLWGRLIFFPKFRSLQKFVKRHRVIRIRAQTVIDENDVDKYNKASEDHCNVGI